MSPTTLFHFVAPKHRPPTATALALLLLVVLTTACSSPAKRAEELAKKYNRQYEIFLFECREAVSSYVTSFEDNVSLKRYDSRKVAYHCLDSLLHICQQKYDDQLQPIEDEYDNLISKRYRLLGDYRQQFEQSFNSIVKYQAADTARFLDSIRHSARIWDLLNSIKDPALPSKEEMAAQLAGTEISCVGDPYFSNRSFVLQKDKTTVGRIYLEKRRFNSQTGNNNVPVEIEFSHGNMDFKGLVVLNYELHDGDLDWRLNSVTSENIRFIPNHAYDNLVECAVKKDNSLLPRLYLTNTSSKPVLVGYWVRYEKIKNLWNRHKEYNTERQLATIQPNDVLIVGQGSLNLSAVKGGVDFVIPQ